MYGPWSLSSALWRWMDCAFRCLSRVSWSRRRRFALYHPTALIESDAIGSGTRIWAYAHVLRGACIGANCNIGDHAFIEGGAVLGDNVTIKNGVYVWDGVCLGDGVFVGPGAVFTNDLYPRSPRLPAVAAR